LRTALVVVARIRRSFCSRPDEGPSVRDDSKWRLPLSDQALLEELRASRARRMRRVSNPELMQATLPVFVQTF